MSIYVNPGNDTFRRKLQDKFLDKTGLIALVNESIGKMHKLSLVSRPRRFGKSYAAQMLCAYYCKGCDSSELFRDFTIANNPSYREHMNKYNVLYLDITTLTGETGADGLLEQLVNRVGGELMTLFPNIKSGSIADMLAEVVETDGSQFIAIIDEWDAPIRDSASTPKIQKSYLDFLRSLFKSSQITDKVFAAAYMTGILPMKKDGSQSAISEFRNYSMLDPWEFAQYIGFTEDEVKSLCKESGMDLGMMRYWYDGYSLGGVGSVYNSNSVMEAIRRRKYQSYWEMSSAAGSVLDYVNLDFEGLGKDVVEMLGGGSVPVDVSGFGNDPRELKSRDDVLTLLTHYGYFSYDQESERIRIPNGEVGMEFSKCVRRVTHLETIRRVKESEALINSTINMDCEGVAGALEKIHNEEFSPIHYNNEQSLRSVIKLGYFTYKDHYTQFEELPGGKGYADIVYLPKKLSGYPILVVELKWDKDVRGAIAQIRNRNYPAQLVGRDEPILLIGVSYDASRGGDKKHSCEMELVER